ARPDNTKKGHQEIQPGLAVADREDGAARRGDLDKIRLVPFHTNSPLIITLSMRSDPNAYGRYASDGTGFVRRRFAHFPRVILPSLPPTDIAKAPFIVAALIASSGSIRSWIQLRAMTRFIFPLGEEPGL